MTDDQHPQPFHEWLESHRRGEATLEWADELAEVVQAVQTHRKAGSLTIKIEIEAKGRSIIVVDKVTTKIPTADREAAVYFGDAAGSLVRDDPMQMSFLTNEAPDTYDRDTGEKR